MGARMGVGVAVRVVILMPMGRIMEQERGW
jgi:hypothetical protein